jgi:hypothetical protein
MCDFWNAASRTLWSRSVGGELLGSHVVGFSDRGGCKNRICRLRKSDPDAPVPITRGFGFSRERDDGPRSRIRLSDLTALRGRGRSTLTDNPLQSRPSPVSGIQGSRPAPFRRRDQTQATLSNPALLPQTSFGASDRPQKLSTISHVFQVRSFSSGTLSSKVIVLQSLRTGTHKRLKLRHLIDQVQFIVFKSGKKYSVPMYRKDWPFAPMGSRW